MVELRRAFVLITGAGSKFGRALGAQASAPLWWRSEVTGTKLASGVDGSGHVQVDWMLWAEGDKTVGDQALRALQRRAGPGWMVSGSEVPALRSHFSEMQEFHTHLDNIFAYIQNRNRKAGRRKGEEFDYDVAFLFHCRRCLGLPMHIRGTQCEWWEHQIQNMMQINAVAPVTVTERFIEAFKPSSRIVVAYATSVASKQAFPSWGMFSSTFAARDMTHRVLAKEHTDVEFVAFDLGHMEDDVNSVIRTRMQESERAKRDTDNLFDPDKVVPAEEAADALLRFISNRQPTGVCHRLDLSKLATGERPRVEILDVALKFDKIAEEALMEKHPKANFNGKKSSEMTRKDQDKANSKQKEPQSNSEEPQVPQVPQPTKCPEPGLIRELTEELGPDAPIVTSSLIDWKTEREMLKKKAQEPLPPPKQSVPVDWLR